MASDPVVDAIVRKLRGPGTWKMAAEDILADADLRAAIGAWQPPMSPAERLARVLWPHTLGDTVNGGTLAAAQRAIDAGYHTYEECDR